MQVNWNIGLTESEQILLNQTNLAKQIQLQSIKAVNHGAEACRPFWKQQTSCLLYQQLWQLLGSSL